jgi:pyruvate dehydrogenase E2 component (dihydrolipoamide acetyltransferase)
MEEGTITKWLKREGEAVEKGEPLLEVMTDKANMEVEAPASGVLLKILAPENAVIPVKDMIAVIGGPGEPIDDLIPSTAGETVPQPTVAVTSSAAAAEQEPASATATGQDGGRIIASPRARRVAANKGIDISLLAGKGTGPGGRVVEQDVLGFSVQTPAGPRITPLAGKVAADIGVDVSAISGTGHGGKVTREDVLRAAAPKKDRQSIAAVIPFVGMRKSIAENVSRSVRTAPHVTLVSEVDVTSAMTMREQLLPELQKRYGVKLTLTALVIKAAALAILDNPIINSSLMEDKIIVHDEINIGMAVALPGGLLVPVVHNADAKPIHQISGEMATLAAKARTGSLAAEEMQGGTFTVTNLGQYGIDSFNPIINPPESAILGVCRSVEKPVIVNGQVQARSMMNLCLSFDHRVIDGAPAAQYLAKIRELLEAPYLLLI